MPDFTVIETQEQFDNAIRSRIDRQNASHQAELSALKESYADYDEIKKANAEYSERLKAYEEATAGTDEKIKGYESLIAEQEAKIKAYEVDSVKNHIALEFGLPTEAIEFLKGDTEEDIRESANKLLQIAPSKKVAPLASENVGTTEDGVTAYFKQMNPHIKI